VNWDDARAELEWQRQSLQEDADVPEAIGTGLPPNLLVVEAWVAMHTAGGV
jgi:hypothetical protein